MKAWVTYGAPDPRDLSQLLGIRLDPERFHKMLRMRLEEELEPVVASILNALGVEAEVEWVPEPASPELPHNLPVDYMERYWAVLGAYVEEVVRHMRLKVYDDAPIASVELGHIIKKDRFYRFDLELILSTALTWASEDSTPGR
ncbi:hypothetical protein [Pyrobaculum neutrophilum]|uniref:Uncharacterized protein n=1 Tax=Pyrobaculum neutrophilum (strain DSM 2338 / JCM 9278 / NBRC 100436 / V24Sta) TaxID=444157 RepID=B1YC73_PYRNV|nr:hypothetical protein [Pyrobaculum neutrophilum]ACB39386.1 hypothetical protein Tneu_0438 [Pyrobaculum neutrophilum V24Sta]